MRIVVTGLLTLWLVAACGNGEEGKNGGGGEPPAPIKAGNTPEATFLAMKEAVAREDFEALIGLFYPGYHTSQLDAMKKALEGEDADEQLATFSKTSGIPVDELRNKSPKELLLLITEKLYREKEGARERYVNAVVKKTEIDGDKAVVFFESGAGKHNATFVMHEGIWYYHPFP